MKLGRAKKSWLSLGSAGLIVFLLQPSCVGWLSAQTRGSEQERGLRVVITNDDGVEELEDRVVPLARALAAFAEVYVVIPAQNRSGTTHHMNLSMGKRSLESELVWSGPLEEGDRRVEVYVVDGYPADCVALALGGILRNDPPDLVISGPNGGPNLGPSWFGSGTIGAARIAAVFGVPAIAISGLDDSEEEAVQALAAWVAQLARSELVLGLEAGQYLTVALPRKLPQEIEGIRIAPRASGLGGRYFEKAPPLIGEGDEGPRQVWLLQVPEVSELPPADSDIMLYIQDYIVVTPMRADEHDYALIDELRGRLAELPAWPPERRP
ncbi:MAG: 5'/3'-nucleotidase SurE [Gemmatimonadales bacterium]|jgi:5'-nucleotidase